MEIDEVVNEPLLPASCFQVDSVDDFFRELEKHDDSFYKKLEAAQKKNEKLRFIATMEDGKARVGLHQ
jgi:bifunctional aspartokinase / homoserine dehydrogenase 1